MKVLTEESDFTKLCHAVPGDVIKLVDSNMLSDGQTFLVCVIKDPSKRAARPNMSHGLYDDQRCMFLVNIETGEMRDMAHLSSRVLIFRKAEVRLGKEARP
jgi:hypothetical protein